MILSTPTPEGTVSAMADQFDFAKEFADAWFVVAYFGDGRGTDAVRGWSALVEKIFAECEVDLQDERLADDWGWSDEATRRPYSLFLSFEDGSINILRLSDAAILALGA